MSCAINLDREDKKVFYARKLIDLGKTETSYYLILIESALKKEDYDLAISILDEAQKHHRSDPSLINKRINIYISTNQESEAINSLKEAIEFRSDDPVLRFNLGVLYDRSKNVKEAIKSYKSVIELDDNYLDAYNNLGIIYYNRAIDYNRELNDMPTDAYGSIKDKIKEKELRDNIDNEFRFARPNFEKVLELNPDEDIQTLGLLLRIYETLGDKEKAEDMKKIIEEISEE